jgi:hypothetical protein
MHVSHEIIGVAVQLVIVVVPALVGAKFLVSPATQNFTAIETFFIHSEKNFTKDI